jgi:hypothetical protein
MTRRLFCTVLAASALSTLLSSLAPAAAWTSERPTAPSRDYTCGDKGKPPCPMQDWMKTKLAPFATDGNTEALAKAFDHLSYHAPPGFAEWSKIARDGAERARKKDLAGAKMACRTCHEKYKAKYKEELRDRPF